MMQVKDLVLAAITALNVVGVTGATIALADDKFRPKSLAPIAVSAGLVLLGVVAIGGFSGIAMTFYLLGSSGSHVSGPLIGIFIGVMACPFVVRQLRSMRRRA